MSFQDLDIHIRYRSEIHNFPRDFLIPVLSQTKIYKRGTGYFSTTSLIQLSVGLFEMAKNGGKIQVVCSPNLDKKDIEAIDYGYRSREEVITEALLREINEPVTYFDEERLNLVATLIANGSFDLKIAFLQDDDGFRLYHEKIAVFIDAEGNRISYAGSVNESENGLDGNFESLYTFCSWKDPSQIEAVQVAENDFDQMWNDNTIKLHVIDFPNIVIQKLMQYKKPSGINWDTDEREYGYKAYLKSCQKFRIPDGIRLHDYQEEAVQVWQANGYKGIFDMCTGSGKTYTALYGMIQLSKSLDEKLAVFIVCPYIHLVSQWEEDVEKWCSVPIIIAHSKSPNREWKKDLMMAYKRFRREGSPFVCITTNDSFAGEELQQYIVRFSETQNVLLIVDEAHNFGSAQMINVMPWNIPYRIALSAIHDRENAQIYRCLKYVDAMYVKASNLANIRKGTTITDLNEIIEENFRRMFKDEEKYAKLGNDYKVHVYYKQVGNKTNLEEENLSNGETIAINFVFIVSILELAEKYRQLERDNEEYGMEKAILGLPLVLDGPFSALSNENTGLVASRLPQFAEQVIIFMLDKDWEASGLEDYTLPEFCYRVNKESSSNSSSLEHN